MSVGRGSILSCARIPASGRGVTMPDNLVIPYWTKQSEVLFFGEISKITDGKLYNQKSGATDYLTVGGSVGSYTFQCPNTASYIAADTDYIWFKTDETPRTTTEAELIGYDLQRTPVKYLDDAPNSISAILILNQTIPTANRDRLFRDFWLMPLWDNDLNAYGHVKSNRATQTLWVPEEVVPATLSDTDLTWAWYDYTAAGTLGIDDPDLVNAWNDINETGHNITGLTTKRPTLTADGVLFNGSANRLISAQDATLDQPTMVYIVFKQVGWTNLDRIWDGYNQYTTLATQNPTTPTFGIYAGGTAITTNELAVGDFGIVVACYDGADSFLKVGDNAAKTGDVGTADFDGFALGASGGAAALQYANICVKEVIIRKQNDSDLNRLSIINYLKNKYSL